MSVTIREVVQGKTIAHGTSSSLLTCDDSPHDYTVSVFPDTSGFFAGSASAPFKKGDAAISAAISNDFYPTTTTAGPQLIRLK